MRESKIYPGNAVRLGLGTAQFGMDYGVSNAAGRTPLPAAGEILRLAVQRGIDLLDTAGAYGDSEEVLGLTLPAAHAFRIVTKTPVFGARGTGPAEAAALQEALRVSLRRLSAPSIYGLLAHNAGDLLAEGGDRLYEAMRALKDAGLVRKIGASVYTASELDALSARYALDIVQVPVNLFDQRLLRSGHLKRLKQAGVEVLARSAFLQGLLLMPVDRIPAYFAPWRARLGEYREAVALRGLSPLQASLAFVLSQPDIDAVVCGVNTARQFEEILAVASAALPALDGVERFALDDEALLNPALWPVEARV